MTIAEEKLAVCVRDAWKRYSPKVVILKGLNMSVVEGSIYGLLGPSGCGKTSLLSCIVGVRSLDTGTIDVTATRKVEVGFMPQEITLNKEFTVSEVFHFYGVIYGMSEEQIVKRGAELVKFLQIPNDDRYIGNCSGGQQRRISMAATLLHDPQILILDEPTVGVDPVLCADIWEHFLDLVQTKHKTIIITTHYIEEAKNANRIGLMRGGILLAEEPPLELMRQYNSKSLEAVFLKLSAKQETDDVVPSTQYYPPKKPYKLPLQNEKMFVFSRFRAQMIKNINWTRRNLPVTAFVICLPALLFFIMGHLNNVKNGDYPVSLRPLALVNDEVEDCRNATPYLKLHKTCQYTRPFSCRYIDSLHQVFKTVEFEKLEDAKEAVRHAHAYGVLNFGANFSQYMMLRLKDQTAAPKHAIEGSDVRAYLDMSEYGYTVRTVRELGMKLLDLLQDVSEECGYERKIAAIPIHLEEEVYTVTDIVHCFVPPYFGSVAFYTTTMFTSSSIVMERSSGLFERSKIAGLTMVEIIVAHVVMQIIVMMLQNTLSFVILYTILHNPMAGNAGTAWLIISLNQLAGMVFGFFLSILIQVEKNVAYAGISTVLTLFMLTEPFCAPSWNKHWKKCLNELEQFCFLQTFVPMYSREGIRLPVEVQTGKNSFQCGTLWPVQGIHWLFRPVSALLPVRYSGEAYLNVALRGYGLHHMGVIKGLVAPVVAIVTLIILSVLAVRTGVGSMD